MADCKLPELLNPRETAVVRRSSVNHLANERSRGIGPPYVKIGGRIYYPADLLREYINSRIVNPNQKAG